MSSEKLCENCGHCELAHECLWKLEGYEDLSRVKGEEFAHRTFEQDHPGIAHCPGYKPGTRDALEEKENPYQ
ncbi:MAG: hypothetical protein UY41_C0004G0018 [Candidatus Moranbacteria bacterium GW2011_GWE1_49_15]|nr:MAG: hypothetical protein UX75_C0005G0020 [Candidatus Moranbacteria bacterium GW2011_GWE2_47_10]KKW07401.1 MAG: hypothetical protein UY41_C0004G0018 [Candidatus Moranbacteria bacterium GW2011_GWE1_49_15]HBP00898.1 hypothetical protein [Candidatus Moranbacteria bacterium]